MEDTAWSDDYYNIMNRDLLKICNKSIQMHGLHKKKKFLGWLFQEWTSGDLTFHYTQSEGKIWWVNPGNPNKCYEVSDGNLIKQLNAMTDERGKRDRKELKDDAEIFKETLKRMNPKPLDVHETIYRTLDTYDLEYISLENNFIGYRCNEWTFKTRTGKAGLEWLALKDGYEDWIEMTHKPSIQILNNFAFYK